MTIINPAHRIMAAIDAPYGWSRDENRAAGASKRRAKRKAQTRARRVTRLHAK